LILALGVTGHPRVVPMKTLLQTVIALAVLVGMRRSSLQNKEPVK